MKLNIYLLITLSFLITNNCFSQSFNYLTPYNKYFSSVKYNPKNTVLINKEFDEDGYAKYTLMKTKIDAGKSTFYKVVFFIGGSEIESYIFLKINANGTETEIASIDCGNVVIPGNGHVYVSGGVNTLYNQRKKFKLTNDKLVEVEQGAYYIGLKTKTNNLITLYADRNKSKKSAVLPKNYNVEILIEQDGWFLIKTPFGLTGWISGQDIKTYPYGDGKITFEDFMSI